ncbi:AAA family ATPase, partial [Ewingella americana]|nr:AAA family ATPase [Ewingella americana]
MELVYLHIEKFRSVRSLSIPLSSKFNFLNTQKKLVIEPIESRDFYYMEIPSTLIVGKNGVGKTSIMEFIDSFIDDFEGSGYCIWYNGCELMLTCSNLQPPKIISSLPIKYIENNRYFFKKYNLKLVKINNTIDMKGLITGSRRVNKSSEFKDQTLSNYLLGGNSKKRKLLIQMLTFFAEGGFIGESILNYKPKFTFSIQPSPMNKINSILKNNAIGDKGLYGAVQYFNEELHELIRAKPSHTNLAQDLQHIGYSEHSLEEQDYSLDDHEIVSMIFNK